MPPIRPFASALLLYLWVWAEIVAVTPEAADAMPVDAPPADGQPVEVVPSSGAGELRDALAKVVIERNEVASQRDSLQQQHWLVIGYALAASLLAVWFLHGRLRRAAPATGGGEPATVRTRPEAPGRRPTNATITIRNAATQQPELVERVSTRRFFRARPQTVPKRETPGDGTATPAAAPPQPAPPAAAPARRAVEEYRPSDAPRPGDRASILLPPAFQDVRPEPVDDTETTNVRIARRDGRDLARSGLSLLEVMIALAVLATVLSSVGSGIFVLSSAKRLADEESAVGGVLRAWSERIVGADWEWLGRDRVDDPLRGAWSWQRPPSDATVPPPGVYPALTEGAADPLHDLRHQLLDDQPSGVAELRCHLEYYRPLALELCFAPAAGADPGALWDEVRQAHRLSPPIDLRQHVDAVVVRLSASWRAQDGGRRQRDLVFVRTR